MVELIEEPSSSVRALLEVPERELLDVVLVLVDNRREGRPVPLAQECW